MSRPAVYWSAGGEVVARPGRRLTYEDALALLSLHLEEACAAAGSKDVKALNRAHRCASDLTAALDGARRWRRASGGAGR